MLPRVIGLIGPSHQCDILPPTTPYLNRLGPAPWLSFSPSGLPSAPDLHRRRWRLFAGRAVGLGLLGYGSRITQSECPAVNEGIWGRGGSLPRSRTPSSS